MSLLFENISEAKNLSTHFLYSSPNSDHGTGSISSNREHPDPRTIKLESKDPKRGPYSKKAELVFGTVLPDLEFLNNLWGLGTE